MSDPIEDMAKEADLLALHIVTGTLRSRHVELGDDNPRVPDDAAQRAERRRRAHVRMLERERRRGWWIHAQREDDTWPYPDPARPSEEQRRKLANDLARDGFAVDYLARRYGLSPRTPTPGEPDDY